MSLLTLQQSLSAVAESQGGELTPAAVLDYARPKASPIHDRFTWDNKLAGEKFRLIEAAMLIRSVRVSFEQADGTPSAPVRAWINQRESYHETGVYVPIQRVLASPEASQELLNNARRDAESFRRKYATLEAASRVVEAIGEFVGIERGEAA
jgi:hypothetical protein